MRQDREPTGRADGAASNMELWGEKERFTAICFLLLRLSCHDGETHGAH